MKINQAELLISAVQPKQFPEDGYPEIAFSGRSNVGKSSLINKLLLRKNLARTSSQPGKTQTLNFYRIKTAILDLNFVDLPGYGYAKVSKTTRQQWGTLIENYLLQRSELKSVLQLTDMRHPPTAEDRAMYEWLTYHQIPCCVVATKADKIPSGKWEKHRKIIREQLAMEADAPLILFSSQTGTGRNEIWKYLVGILE